MSRVPDDVTENEASELADSLGLLDDPPMWARDCAPRCERELWCDCPRKEPAIAQQGQPPVLYCGRQVEDLVIAYARGMIVGRSER